MKFVQNLHRLTQNKYSRFELLHKKIRAALNENEIMTNNAIREYIRFMQMSAEHEGMIPSKIVDTVWHEHIQFTKDYAEFCDFITEDSDAGSRFIHHNPDDPRVPTKHIETNNNYQNTLDWYVTMFDEEPRADIWLYSNLNEWFGYKFSKKRTYRKLRPLPSNVRSGGVGVDPDEIVDNVMLAAVAIDMLTDTDPNYDDSDVFESEMAAETEQIIEEAVEEVDEVVLANDISEKAESVFDHATYNESKYEPDPVKSEPTPVQESSYTSEPVKSTYEPPVSSCSSSSDSGSSSSCSSSSCSSSD